MAIFAIAVGMLAAAGSACADAHGPGVTGYNGHAGLGASLYEHNQTDLESLACLPLGTGVKDGTSNTLAFGERFAAPRGFSIDCGSGAGLMADMGGQFR